MLFIYLKTTLKELLSTAFITFFSLVAIPIMLVMFMGTVYGFEESSENKLNLLVLVDEDKSEESVELINYINGNEFNKIFKVTDTKDVADKVIIKKGYGESNSKNKYIIIEDNTGSDNLKLLKDKLEKYNYGNLENSVVNSVVIKNIKSDSLYELMAYKLLTFIVGMLIYNLICNQKSDISRNLSLRMYSLPLSKMQIFIYDFISAVFVNIIIFSLYAFIFNILNIAFMGNVLLNMFILIVTAIYTASISYLIINFFSEKYAKFVGITFFILSMAIGGIFTVEEMTISKILPTYYIINILRDININNSELNLISNIFSILILICIIIFAIVFKIYKRKEVDL